MLAIELELLAGRYIATQHDDREHAEWPPHPARLVYALVATAGAERTADEEEAIAWLCAQPPPAMAFASAYQRKVVTTYVPVNDCAVADAPAAAGAVPRLRQPRTFPSVVPESPIVTYIWPDAGPDTRTRRTLASLANGLVYLGHSSSLVRVALVDSAPPPTLVPGRGAYLLRVPAEGLLRALDASFAREEATGVRGPLPADYVAYGIPGPPQAIPHRSVFDEIVALRRTGGPRLPLAAVEQVAMALRAAVLRLVPNPVPDSISGHDGNGGPLARPHIAFLGLPDVGHPHAGGSLLGVAAVLPRDLTAEANAALLVALANLSTLRISRSARWTVEPARFDSERPLPHALRRETWMAPARRYATATPIELDHHVDDRLGREAELVVAASAGHIGLPQPTRISLSPVSAFAGGGHVHDVRRRSDRPRRPLVHAILEFGDQIEGPVLLGSGRYRGLGLCRPLMRT